MLYSAMYLSGIGYKSGLSVVTPNPKLFASKLQALC